MFFYLCHAHIRLLMFFCLATLLINFPGRLCAEDLQKGRSPQQLADILYTDMKSIAAAVDVYQERYQQLPSSEQDLLEGQIVQKMQSYPEEFVSGRYFIQARYDDMDGKGDLDDTIYTGDKIPETVCIEFNKRYAMPPLNTGEVFDYQAAGAKYPGAVYGRHMEIYAIKWETANKTCEINWVIAYH